MIKYHSWELFEPIKLKLLNQKMQVSWWSLQDESTWRANQEQIKSKSRANQEPIKSKSIFSINFKSIFPIKISINIISRFCVKKILIEILILKFTFQINSWEDQNLDCNHYAMLRGCVCAEAPLRMTQDPHQINDINTPLRSLANVSEWSKGVRPSPPARTLLWKICWVLSVYHFLPPKKVMIYLLRSLANVSEWSKGVRPSPPARTLLWKICWVLSVYHFLPPKKVMIYLLRSLANVSEWSKGVWPSPLARTLILKICWVLSVYHSLPPKKVMIYLLRSLANVSEWSKGVRPSPPARTLLWKICWVLSVYHFLPPKKVMIYLLRSLANVSEWSKGVWPSPLARTLLLKICWVLSVYHSLPPKRVMIYLLRSLANVCERSQGVRWSHLLRSPPSLKAGLLGDIVKDQLCWKGLSFEDRLTTRWKDLQAGKGTQKHCYPENSTTGQTTALLFYA